MKKIIFNLLIFLIICPQLESQEKVSLQLFQDAKFALLGDKERGYKPGTIDALIRFKMQGIQQNWGYLVVSPEYEYANIQNIYRRYSASLGYTFNRLILKNAEITPSINYGWIDRQGSTWSYGFTLETMYKLFDNRLKIGFLHQFTHRTDLHNRKLGYSFFGGVEINLN